ncbi:SH2 domain-containing protein 3C isoform X2 [Hyla sarda]|uniref:SH2 domain-containing protein 3C isoform X2 n=1 Tax=Hyla sarda TaxID=327740 RepID=UPI0024C38F50|nr:SH2 domain-containing protein 3C isoform X2 [Hyla sarda]
MAGTEEEDEGGGSDPDGPRLSDSGHRPPTPGLSRCWAEEFRLEASASFKAIKERGERELPGTPGSERPLGLRPALWVSVIEKEFFKLNVFGSLSSLPRAFRRKDSQNSEGCNNVSVDQVFQKTQDDLTTIPKSPSYARSSDMYSHMGTMPRISKKLSKSKKEKSKGHPSTMAAHSTNDLLDQDASDIIVVPSLKTQRRTEVSPIQDSVNGQREEVVKDNCDGRPSNSGPRSPEVTPDVTEKVEDRTIEEEVTKSKDSSDESTCSSLDGGSEYVKFSKEKYILDTPPEKLHKELEEELKLNSSDLRSHAWYHGRIPREVSENLVQRNGDFLIRDSLTSLGDYVLTCRWKNDSLHFKINKVMVKTSDSYTRIQYLFEQESFDNIPALVRFYVGSRRAVSDQSGALIYCPINRTFPLRYLEASYGLSPGRQGSQSPQKGHMKRRSITMTDGLTADKITKSNGCPNSASSPHHRDIVRTCAVSVDQIQDLHSPMSPISETPGSPAYSTVVRVKPQGTPAANVPPGSPVLRRSSEPYVNPANNKATLNMAESTHSTPSHGYPPISPSPSINSYSDPDNGHYCQLRPASPTHDTYNKPLPPKSYVERLKVDEGIRAGVTRVVDDTDKDRLSFTIPSIEAQSSFNPSAFKSMLIPADNKPLEMCILKKVKELFSEVDAKTIAKHITKTDCEVARILGVTKEMQRTMGVSSGMELLTLPHGRQLRLDLLERFHTMSIMIAVDILGCTGSTEERAALLHKTIQLAAELKGTLGNLYSFAAVMNALELVQISRLEQTWIALRQRHTEGAILYEKKLKPFLKSMNEGKESLPLSNTTFPHILPLITLLERDSPQLDGGEPWDSIDNGVEVVMSHLEAARMVAHHGGLYRTNAEMRLQGFHPRSDLLEVSSTEFQMRMLWGSRGAAGSQAERYDKFDKVLTALSHKLEPSVRFSEL